MRIRPASINYLVDASLRHVYELSLAIIIVEEVTEEDRLIDDDKIPVATINDEELNDHQHQEYDFRSVHSSDFDMEFPYESDDDDDPIVCCDRPPSTQTKDNGDNDDDDTITLKEEPPLSITLLEQENLPLHEIPKETLVPKVRREVSPLALKVLWFLFFHQRRIKCISNVNESFSKETHFTNRNTIHVDNDPSSSNRSCSTIPLSFLHVIEAIVSSARHHQSPLLSCRSVPLHVSPEATSLQGVTLNASKETPRSTLLPTSTAISSSRSPAPCISIASQHMHVMTPARTTSLSSNVIPPSAKLALLQDQTPGSNSNQHRMCYTDDTSDESESGSLQHDTPQRQHCTDKKVIRQGELSTPHESSRHHYLEEHYLSSRSNLDNETLNAPRKIILDNSPKEAVAEQAPSPDVVDERDHDIKFPADNLEDAYAFRPPIETGTTPNKESEQDLNDDFEFPVDDYEEEHDDSFSPPVEAGTAPKKEAEQDHHDDFDFPVDDHDDSFGPPFEARNPIPKKELTEEHDRSESKKHHKKKKKSKKSRKDKKKHKSSSKKRNRDDSSSVGRKYSKHRRISSGRVADKVQLSKITPETDRRKSAVRASGEEFYDPRVKPYKPGRSNAPDTLTFVVKRDPGAIISPNPARILERTPKQQVLEDQSQLLHCQDLQPTKEASRSKLGTPTESDNLEIPYESPEPTPKRKRATETHHQEAAHSSKRTRTQPEESAHVLCSESFIESCSQAAASLACGSWLGNDQSAKATQAHSISLHDSALLDEMGVDIEIDRKGAISVQRLSTWGKEKDLKVLIRELVKLTALGRYRTILVILVVDIAITPSLARDIAFVQGTPLGNTDCIVTFQMVAQCTALAAAIARRVLRARAKFKDRVVNTSMFDALLPDCYQQIAFLLQIASSLPAIGALQLLWNEDKKAPYALNNVFQVVEGSSVAARQLRWAALAGLNRGLEREI